METNETNGTQANEATAEHETTSTEMKNSWLENLFFIALGISVIIGFGGGILYVKDKVDQYFANDMHEQATPPIAVETPPKPKYGYISDGAFRASINPPDEAYTNMSAAAFIDFYDDYDFAKEKHYKEPLLILGDSIDEAVLDVLAASELHHYEDGMGSTDEIADFKFKEVSNEFLSNFADTAYSSFSCKRFYVVANSTYQTQGTALLITNAVTKSAKLWACIPIVTNGKGEFIGVAIDRKNAEELRFTMNFRRYNGQKNSDDKDSYYWRMIRHDDMVEIVERSDDE